MTLNTGEPAYSMRARVDYDSVRVHWFDGLRDIIAGARAWPLWSSLALRDIRLRYQRTMLGPFWTVLSSTILIVALGVVYSVLWKADLKVFLPFFSAGYITWIMFVSILTEGGNSFLAGSAMINATSLPMTVNVYRTLLRIFIIFLHTFIVHIFVLLYFRVPIHLINVALLLLGLVFFYINALWLSLASALLCTRFRDAQQAIVSVVQILFFITPVFWPPEAIKGNAVASQLLVHWNFAFHIVDIIRSPLIGKPPMLESYIYLAVCFMIGAPLTLLSFSIVRRRVAYWL